MSYDTRKFVELQDVSATGKKRPWNERKRESVKISTSFDRLGYQKVYERIAKCGRYLEFKRYYDNSMKLYHAYFCKNRLCALCNWRRSLIIYHQMMDCVNLLQKDNDFLFLTLTVRNCEFNDLNKYLDDLKESLNRLFRRKEVKKAVQGSFYAFEITLNRTDLTWHPHIHVCICVTKCYFKKGYVSQKSWTKYWQESCNLDYTPIVHIEKFKGDLSKAVAEGAKYTLKTNSILSDDTLLQDQIVDILYDAMYGRRFIGFRGCFKEARKILGLKDIDESSFVNVDNEKRDGENYILERYFFQSGYNDGSYVKVD